MEELLFEISEIEHYLGAPIMAGGKPRLPLGTIGHIMSSELQQQTRDVAEQTYYIACEQNVGAWEKMKTSLYLHKKIAMLVTLTGIIAQLPAYDAQAQTLTSHYSQRIIEQCQKIDVVLDAFVSETVVISASLPAEK